MDADGTDPGGMHADGSTEWVERVDEQDRVIGLVDRAEAIRRHYLHRVATAGCHAPDGRILVHRRPADDPRFPGHLNWLFGGGVEPGESYPQAAARELTEELGVPTRPRLLFTVLCRGAISPYWLGVHHAEIPAGTVPLPAESSWHGWFTADELEAAFARHLFVPDAVPLWPRYRALLGLH